MNTFNLLYPIGGVALCLILLAVYAVRTAEEDPNEVDGSPEGLTAPKRLEGVHGCWEQETPEHKFQRESYVSRHVLTPSEREFAEARQAISKVTSNNKNGDLK